MGEQSVLKGRWLGICFLLLLLAACKSTGSAAAAGLDKNLPAKTVIRDHYRNQPAFKTLSGKMKIDYSDGREEQSFGVSLRMEKDKVIWMSAPLGIVKAYITPERVSFYNKLQNECFDGDFTYLSNLLGTELNFEKVQNLLLGQALYDLRDEKFDMAVAEGAFELKPKKAMELFKILFRIEPKNFRIASEMLSQPEKKRLLEIRYQAYAGKDFQLLPGTIGIAAIEDQKRTLIAIAYRNMEFNRALSFPYEIPKGCEDITSK